MIYAMIGTKYNWNNIIIKILFSITILNNQKVGDYLVERNLIK